VGRKFAIETFGCQMNEHDSARIAADLELRGLERADEIGDADVIVLNTCCIRENAETKLFGHLGHLKSLVARKPDLQIAVGGCLAQREGAALLARAPHVAAIFGTHNVGRAGHLLDQASRTGDSVVEVLGEAPEDGEAFPSALPVRPELHYAAWVTIQIGCDNSCAFCIVPSVRGRERSRPFAELIAEVGDLARRGTSEVTLLGQNVNSYGRDLTMRLRSDSDSPDHEAELTGTGWARDPRRRPRPLFADLLRAIGTIEGIRRIRFTSPHPKDLRAETIAAMAETDAVCEQLHLPLQSGSDRLLKAMRRGYTAERYLERLAAARQAIDDLAVTTDVIVGFPGETERDFEQTLEVVAEAGYDGAFTFIFSPRPGTRAADMADQFVAPEVIADRFERLKRVVDRSALIHNERRIGRVEEVVVEGSSKKDLRVLAARTRQGKLVHFDPGRAQVEPGTYAHVRVTGAGAHHLSGEIVDRTIGRAARPRRLIPVTAR
jgi:tRNA-2-methylthio-N6-dimethylallyladenosine synthase